MILNAPASLVYASIFTRVANRYGDRGINRYIPMDIGHSGQNVYLQVEALGLGTCAIGAFNDERVHDVLELPAEEHPLYIMPVGHTTVSG
jgi:SagB-type dehydrogenase family enzyme